MYMWGICTYLICKDTWTYIHVHTDVYKIWTVWEVVCIMSSIPAAQLSTNWMLRNQPQYQFSQCQVMRNLPEEWATTSEDTPGPRAGERAGQQPSESQGAADLLESGPFPFQSFHYWARFKGHSWQSPLIFTSKTPLHNGRAWTETCKCSLFR